jgi:hypothetical protein
VWVAIEFGAAVFVLSLLDRQDGFPSVKSVVKFVGGSAWYADAAVGSDAKSTFTKTAFSESFSLTSVADCRSSLKTILFGLPRRLLLTWLMLPPSKS